MYIATCIELLLELLHHIMRAFSSFYSIERWMMKLPFTIRQLLQRVSGTYVLKVGNTLFAISLRFLPFVCNCLVINVFLVRGTQITPKMIFLFIVCNTTPEQLSMPKLAGTLLLFIHMKFLAFAASLV